jgi:quercetin 2,3-dioxygenase
MPRLKFEDSAMIQVRPSQARGHTQLEWLDSRHTFSFGDYYDAKAMGFRDLRVINDDHIGPGTGFGAHPHRDMEIVTYVLEGALEHKDNLGNGSVIRAGDVQAMSAGSGVMHSEKNPSRTERIHLLQIWIVPSQRGLTPAYADRSLKKPAPGERILAVSRDGRDQSLLIHQDVDLWIATADAAHPLSFDLAPKRHAWVQVTRGAISLNGTPLGEGDGAAVSEERKLEIVASKDSEALLFDLK